MRASLKMVFLLCALVAGLLGCERKPAGPPEGKAPEKPGAVVAPAGMKLVRYRAASDREAVFSLDAQPVTNAEYRTFYDRTRAGDPQGWENGGFTEAQAALPLQLTDPEVARDYAAWSGKRLPTQAEWEAAKDIVGSVAYPYVRNTAIVPCLLCP